MDDECVDTAGFAIPDDQDVVKPIVTVQEHYNFVMVNLSGSHICNRQLSIFVDEQYYWQLFDTASDKISTVSSI